MTALSNRAASILCIGNISVDESIYLDGTRTLAAGGDAVYAALAALHVTPSVRVLAPVGNDLPPQTLTELSERGLAVDALPRRDLPTLRHVIRHRADGGRDWFSHASEAEFDAMSVQSSDLSAGLLDVDAVLLTAMGLRAQATLAPWLAVNSRATTYLDLREDYLDAREDLLTMISVSDVFMPSEIEARTLAKTANLAVAAEFFVELGPSTVVIKRGARGCLVAAEGRLEEVPADVVPVVDTTGAGDAFSGAFAAAHAAGGDAVAAARQATTVAGVAVGGLGTGGLLAHLRTRESAS